MNYLFVLDMVVIIIILLLRFGWTLLHGVLQTVGAGQTNAVVCFILAMIYLLLDRLVKIVKHLLLLINQLSLLLLQLLLEQTLAVVEIPQAPVVEFVLGAAGPGSVVLDDRRMEVGVLVEVRSVEHIGGVRVAGTLVAPGGTTTVLSL